MVLVCSCRVSNLLFESAYYVKVQEDTNNFETFWPVCSGHCGLNV